MGAKAAPGRARGALTPEGTADSFAVVHLDFVMPVLHHRGDVRFMSGVARALTAAGCSVGLIALSREGEGELRRSHEHVFYLYEGLAAGPPEPAEVARVETRYRLGNLADLVYTERNYFGAEPAALFGRAVHAFGFLEHFLETHSVGLFANNLGGEVIRMVMHRIGLCGGPPNLWFDYAPFHGRIALSRSDSAWDDMPSPLPALTTDERRFIEELAAEVTTRKRMFTAPAPLGINLGSLARPFKNFVETALSPEGDHFSLGHIYSNRLRHIARRTVNPRLYQQPVANEPYLFFPLHVPGDTAITVRAPQFQRQEALIEYLAERALPTGMKLYVKPHPAGPDVYAIPMLLEIARRQEVRLIDPRVNSHTLIEAARGVVVINSTVGFEALFYGKPVVVLSQAFYSGHGVTTDVTELGRLNDHVAAALSSPPPREAVLRFLSAAYHSTSKGVMFNENEQNLADVAAALVRKASRMGIAVGHPATAGSGAPAL